MKTKNRIFGDWNDLHVDLENIFDHVLGGHRSHSERTFVPRSAIAESETGFIVNVELPGVTSEDVSVEVADGSLTVSGQKRVNELPENITVHRDERIVGKFHRAFEFPTQVDFDKIDATFKNGVLEINLPKSAQVLPRKVQVKSAG